MNPSGLPARGMVEIMLSKLKINNNLSSDKMKPILSIKIHEEGEEWTKEIRLFGLLIYRRHDFTKDIERRKIGFRFYNCIESEIKDEEYYDE